MGLHPAIGNIKAMNSIIKRLDWAMNIDTGFVMNASYPVQECMTSFLYMMTSCTLASQQWDEHEQDSCPDSSAEDLVSFLSHGVGSLSK